MVDFTKIILFNIKFLFKYDIGAKVATVVMSGPTGPRVLDSILTFHANMTASSSVKSDGISKYYFGKYITGLQKIIC